MSPCAHHDGLLCRHRYGSLAAHGDRVCSNNLVHRLVMLEALPPTVKAEPTGLAPAPGWPRWCRLSAVRTARATSELRRHVRRVRRQKQTRWSSSVWTKARFSLSCHRSLDTEPTAAKNAVRSRRVIMVPCAFCYGPWGVQALGASGQRQGVRCGFPRAQLTHLSLPAYFSCPKARALPVKTQSQRQAAMERCSSAIYVECSTRQRWCRLKAKQLLNPRAPMNPGARLITKCAAGWPERRPHINIALVVWKKHCPT